MGRLREDIAFETAPHIEQVHMPGRMWAPGHDASVAYGQDEAGATYARVECSCKNAWRHGNVMALPKPAEEITETFRAHISFAAHDPLPEKPG